MGRVSLSCSQVGLASVLWEGSAYHALKVGCLLSSYGKGQLILLSGWVCFFLVMGRVSLSCSQVGLASVLWEGSAYHALRLGWLLSSYGKGQLIMLSG
jgi:hypothetical protein